MHGIGKSDQAFSRMIAHDQPVNISLQPREGSSKCCGQPPSCQCRSEASRGRILRDLQNASEGDLSESHHQPLPRASPDSYESKSRFIPRGSLLQILGKRTVAGHLSTLLDDSQPLDQLADYISPGQEGACHCGDGLCTGSRILFACLMRIGREDRIVHLYNQPTTRRVCDGGLPFSDGGRFPEALNGLKEKEKQLFRHAQWQLRSHYLTKLNPEDQNFRQLDDEASLPFLHIDEGATTINGGLSIVRHIRIDSEHHDLCESSSHFALKTFKKGPISEEYFRKELRANQQAPRHDRIVPVLTAFKHRRRFHLILPYASGGNLEELWTTYSSRGALGGRAAPWYSTQWLLSECLGIAESLAATHQPTITTDQGGQRNSTPQVHADIKPRNILCFGTVEGGHQSYTLKLADFGFARKVNGDSTLQVGDVTHTKTYRPPEYDVEDFIHLNYDVWCLGCVYLEFITWAVLGWSAVENFTNRRLGEYDGACTSEAKGEDYEDTFFKKVSRIPRWYDLSGLKFEADRNTKSTSKKTATSQRSFRMSRGKIPISCQVKESVKSHIVDIRNQEVCVPEIREFLDFVEEKMLVIDAGKRVNSSEVEIFLRDMTDRQNDQD
ncbi:hypothetical protein ANO14919_049260 [Xylariales sp. No.14919]|nr:hypothetical protein ANO14919_049260 [Xylariales sp. No.14919]